MVSVLALSVVDRGCKSDWVKSKTKKLVFVAALVRRKEEDWLAQNQNNV